MLSYNMGEGTAMISHATNDNGLSKILPFWITGIGDFTCNSHYFTKRFGSDQCLALFTISGHGTLQYKTDEVVVGEGDVVVINCNNFQYYATKGSSDWHFKWAHFIGLCANTYVDHINSKGLFVAKSNSDIDAQVDFIFERIPKMESDFSYELALSMHSILTNIQTQRINSGSIGNGRSENSQAEINSALAFIQDSYHKQINVAEIARVCNLSEYHFIRVFSDYTGCTPYAYILGLRIHEAKKLLLETRLSISEIAYATGFNETKTLINNFKKREGVTPLYYRNNYTFNL